MCTGGERHPRAQLWQEGKEGESMDSLVCSQLGDMYAFDIKTLLRYSQTRYYTKNKIKVFGNDFVFNVVF